MAQSSTETDMVELRWQLPRPVVDGVKAAHLIQGDGLTLMEFVAKILREGTPEAFRK